MTPRLETGAAGEALKREVERAPERAGDAVGAVLRGRIERRASERVPFRAWATKLPEPKTGPLDFRRFPFQVELYTQGIASAVEGVVMKASQIGISALLLRWVLYWADMRGVTSLYVFPKLKQMYDFSDARVRAVILKSAYLQRRIPATYTQNKGLKQIGLGFVYFRGSESKDDLESVDADVLALDEYDNLVPGNIPIAEHRLGASELGLMRRVGVPSYPNYGLDKLWRETDQRRWLVKCPGCAAEEPLRWPGSVDVERAVRVCSGCGHELRPQEVAAGRWVAERPDADVFGYHGPKLIVPGLNVARLIRRSSRTDPEERQSFFNRDVAEAWAPAEGRLSREAIAAAMDRGAEAGSTRDAGAYQGGGLVTMGVDVASVRALNVRVSRHLEDQARRKVCLYLGTVASFDALDELMGRFGVSIAGVDAAPERRLAASFAERHAGRVYLVQFAELADVVLRVVEEERLAKFRRTELLDATLGLVRNQRNLLPPDAPPEYAEQLANVLRVKETAPDGRKKVRYIATGAVDWAMAEAYDVAATDLWTVRQTVDLAGGEEVTALEDHMEYERSALEEEEEGYRGGPDDTYSEGFEG